MGEKISRSNANVNMCFSDILPEEREKGAGGWTAPRECGKKTEDQPVVDGQEPGVIGGGAAFSVHSVRCGHCGEFLSRTDGG